MQRFYDYDENRLYYTSRDGNIFDLSLIERVVIIKGESATGKTFLTQEIKNHQKSCDKSCVEEEQLANVVIYDEHTVLKDDRVLYIIDRGDTVLTDKLCDKIVNAQYARFLIFARGSYKLYLHPRCLGNFIRTGNIIKAEYPYDGWW